MKTGGPSQRLSEKLNADLDTIRRDQADLMASQLQNFSNDLTTIATNARHTIEADTLPAVSEMNSIWQRHTRKFRKLLNLSPWLMMATAALVIASLLALSWVWTKVISTHELMTLGLTPVTHNQMTVLLLDPERTRLRTCIVLNQTLNCIEIRED